MDFVRDTLGDGRVFRVLTNRDRIGTSTDRRRRNGMRPSGRYDLGTGDAVFDCTSSGVPVKGSDRNRSPCREVSFILIEQVRGPT
jgi:hypothetical protein